MSLSIRFKKFLGAVGALASIAGVALAGYQIGLSRQIPESKTLRVEIQNTVAHVISSLPVDRQPEARELLSPISELVSIEGVEEGVRESEAAKAAEIPGDDLPLSDFFSEGSPYVPPLNKVQYLCGGAFLVTYRSHYKATSHFIFASPTELLGARSLAPGELQVLRSGDKRLTMVVLEFRENIEAPLIQFSCDG